LDYKDFVARLSRAAVRRTLSHAYIIEAPSGELGRTAADALIRLVLCREPGEEGGCGNCLPCRKLLHGNHEDLIVVEPDGGSIKKDQILELQARLKNRPYEGDRNVALITQADKMNPVAQNKLLKTLEEPPGRAVIVLVSANVENLLQTIRSRCVICRLTEESEGGEFPDMQDAALAVGKMMKEGKAFYLVSEAMKPALESRDQARAFLDSLEDNYRELGLSRRDISFIEEARRKLDRDMRPAYALKDMILKILAGDSLPTGGYYD